MSKTMKTYCVIMDGYVAQGNSSPHEYLGEYTATSPKAACRKALKDHGYDMQYWESSSCSYWGCKMTAEERSDWYD